MLICHGHRHGRVIFSTKNKPLARSHGIVLQSQTRCTQPPVESVKSPATNEPFGTWSRGILSGESGDNGGELEPALVGRMQCSDLLTHDGDGSHGR